MIINKIILKNFQLFSDAEINFSKTNLINGVNFDSQELNNDYSGNGSGKSTIVSSILFCLFGEVTGINLKDLIKIGEKECSIELHCSQNGKQYKIIRKIPSDLQIWSDEGEHKFNTASIAQKWLNELIGEDLNKFRTYRMIDQNKGIDLLGLGIVSLRKSLMGLVNTQFIGIRNNLLAKKMERENFNVNKKLYHFYLSTKRQTILENGLLRLQEELNLTKQDCDNQSKLLGNYKSEISSRNKIIYFKEQDKKKLNGGVCPILNVKCSQIGEQLSTVNLIKNKEIGIINAEIKEINNLLQSEEDLMNHYNNVYAGIQSKIQKTKECLMKLKEAFRFKEYKFTASDVTLYNDSIKTLDSFSAYYVMEWLNNLSFILNDLLRPININVKFSIEKDFIKVNDGKQELKYEQLSSGQKTFINTVFKIGILLNEGISEGLLLIDEGINTCDQISFQKLLEIISNLQFQSIIIYQNVNKEIKEVNYINVERKNGVSAIK